MRHLRLAHLTLLVVVLATLSGVAAADSLVFSGITWNVTVGPSNTVTMTVQCTTLATCGTWYMGDQAVKAFNSYGGISSYTGPSGYVAQTGGLNNNGCSGSGSGFICWNDNAPYTLMGGTLFTFTAVVSSPSAVSPYSVKGLFYSDSQGESKVLQVSQDTTGSQVPEPSSMLLLGSGLAGLAGIVRRKLRK